MTDVMQALSAASSHGHVPVLRGGRKRRQLCLCDLPRLLQWWMDSGIGLDGVYSRTSFTLACTKGHLSRVDLSLSSQAMASASENGRVAVLQWWKESGYDLKFTEWAIVAASLNCHIAVLDWWKDSRLELKYSSYAMDNAAGSGDLEF
ncbi:hypothetical protein DFJ73DRAFT_834325 [Zopfochytrium polystomum]|nr:hypothetical protein DFJ73DRAFT_834325 [Zopfochytrium polystomum]